MTSTHKYKKAEAAFGSLEDSRSFSAALLRFFGGVARFFDGKLTLMIVPHSEGKVYCFQSTFFALFLGIVIVFAIVFSFVYFNQRNVVSGREIARLREENRETMASLDELREENAKLLQTAKRFQSALSGSLSLVGITQGSLEEQSLGKNSELSSLFDAQDISAGSLRESSDIRQLSSYLDSAVRPVEQIGKMLENQGALFADIPNVWPVKNGIGHISMEFGQNIHPITRQWYIHKGLDFSTWRQGDPVIATANGQVVSVAYDQSYGLSVIIKHKHGIYTRYAHLGTTRVRKGDVVSQRQVIGTIGNTGISTGPHLHYEVHIGSDVVDPAKYINVK